MPMTRLCAVALAALLQYGAATARAHDDTANAQIAEQVRSAIFKRAELAGDDIAVQTRDGVVYLHGLVDTSVERAAVESLAQQTPGVKRVVNALELRNRTR